MDKSYSYHLGCPGTIHTFCGLTMEEAPKCYDTCSIDGSHNWCQACMDSINAYYVRWLLVSKGEESMWLSPTDIAILFANKNIYAINIGDNYYARRLNGNWHMVECDYRFSYVY